jgi:DNA (cytosine-5)-methyltransferase 1
MTEVKRIELAMPVTVRKHEVDIEGLRELLRSAKKEVGISNRKLSEQLNRPITEVEHWFRTDKCFSVPDAEVWDDLKTLLQIETGDFDAQVTEFTEKPGVFEKANRFYDVSGIAPTLTVASADEKIIIDENETKGSDVMTKINEVNVTPFDGKPFTYVSLFSGIGGFEQALNKLGGTCVMASEIDKFANQSYELLYGHKTVGDITKVEAEDVPDHDVLVGGFPCQAFSVAGKRGGFDDARGTLFFEIARLAKVKQPRAMLLENVKGLVGHDKGKTLDTIVTTLNQIGYTVDFNVLNSKYFGVPQNRERIFIIALRDDLIEPAEWTIEGTNVVAKGKRRISQLDGVKTFNFNWPEQTEVTTRLRDVLEPVVDERYYLSEEKTANLVKQLDEGLAIKEATKKGYAIANEGGAVNYQFPDSKTRRGRVGKEIANTIGASGINQGVVEAKMKEVASPEDLSYCIDANYTKGIAPSGIGKGRRTHVEETKPRYRIRKLTPLECLRLQGFPDDVYYTLKNGGLSDSQIYKQSGNAVTTKKIEAIGRRLLPMITESEAE